MILGALLLLAVPFGGAFASTEIVLASTDDSAYSNAYAGNGTAIRPAGYGFCPSIAETMQVRNKGIDYLRTREFAEAVSAVANGTSEFAPMRVPEEWKGAASFWMETVTVNGKPKIAVAPGEAGPGRTRVVLLSPNGSPIDPKRLGLEARTCNPELLFRASMEYRSRKGQEDAPLLYPHLVRNAASGIEKYYVARMDTAGRIAKRADDVAGRILRAEKAGAGKCLPQELARAKAELTVARAGITNVDFDPGATEAVLAKAESLSEALQSPRSYAALHGIRCVQE
jgi:hypothetical protein